MSSKWASRLLLGSVLRFGAYYAYDVPGSLNTQLMKHFNLEFSEWQAVLGLFVGLVAVGQVLFALSVSGESIWLMVFGRVVLGIGGEASGVAVASLIAQWKDHQVLGMSLNSVVCTLGSVMVASLSPILCDWWGVGWAVWIGILPAVVSFIASIVLVSSLQKEQMNASEDICNESTPLVSVAIELSECQESLPTSFWILATLFILDYALVCFNNTASAFLIDRWFPDDPVSAGFAMRYSSYISNIHLIIPHSIPTSISTIVLISISPFISINRSSPLFLMASFSLFALAHILFGFFKPYLHPTLALLGVGYAINTCILWPLVSAVVVNPVQLSNAYGICTALFNVALVTTPMAVAAILGGSECQGGSLKNTQPQFDCQKIVIKRTTTIVTTSKPIVNGQVATTIRTETRVSFVSLAMVPTSNSCTATLTAIPTDFECTVYDQEVYLSPGSVTGLIALPSLTSTLPTECLIQIFLACHSKSEDSDNDEHHSDGNNPKPLKSASKRAFRGPPLKLKNLVFVDLDVKDADHFFDEIQELCKLILASVENPMEVVVKPVACICNGAFLATYKSNGEFVYERNCSKCEKQLPILCLACRMDAGLTVQECACQQDDCNVILCKECSATNRPCEVCELWTERAHSSRKQFCFKNCGKYVCGDCMPVSGWIKCLFCTSIMCPTCESDTTQVCTKCDRWSCSKEHLETEHLEKYRLRKYFKLADAETGKQCCALGAVHTLQAEIQIE
ncbi:MFS general substrate transporter [Rhizoclosmatium globosum]|uniref:Lysosomal dipeptide transporter MFSD1 n=1 Tax=Rhizoclosmatium globosum TaxID=329046 RepID=A0A1Y2AMT6_9FUNG|nr:MFS general substrate transporter [Rhizoclosmatium globosum]|eukprot:ORY23893.1 MFS general substrate transporter [Rhizoclosmatium globosum]